MHRLSRLLTRAKSRHLASQAVKSPPHPLLHDGQPRFKLVEMEYLGHNRVRALDIYIYDRAFGHEIVWSLDSSAYQGGGWKLTQAQKLESLRNRAAGALWEIEQSVSEPS